MQQEYEDDESMEYERSVTSVDWLRRVVDRADLNVLRVALYQLTGRPELRNVLTDQTPTRGGAYFIPTVAESVQPEIKKIAVELMQHLPDPVPPVPDREVTRELMEILTEKPLSDSEFEFGYEELSFDDFPRDVAWTNGRPEAASDFRVAVIGAGISGIAVAIQLKRLGVPYTVFDRQHDLGGTWCLNTYPEARVDTSIFLYQYTFEKNYPWRHHFATQAEVKEYLEYIAEKYGVRSDFRFGVEITSAKWDDTKAMWILTAQHSDGTVEVQEANAIISAAGLFSKPRDLIFEGMETFKGEVCHTASWNHDLDVKGKTVCLVGTGSTGVQITTHLAEQAAHLTVIQRTPSWVGPVAGYKRSFTEEEHWLFQNVPYYWNWYSYQAFAVTSILQAGQENDLEWQAAGGTISKFNDTLRENLTTYIKTKFEGRPDLIEKCTPKYAPLARRLVVDNGFYDALLQPNVELVVAGVDRFVPEGIVTTDGEVHPCDIAVLAIGYEVSRYFWPVRFVGRNGQTLEDLWSTDGARSYLGMVMPGFPNLFTIWGPNGAPRAGGTYSWSEIWSRYSVAAIVQLIESGQRSMEVKAERFVTYNIEMDQVMEGLIWRTQGMGSYHLNEYGRAGFNCPLRVDKFHDRLVRPDLADYEFSP